MDSYIARVAAIQKGLELLMTEMKDLNQLMTELKDVKAAVAAVEVAAEAEAAALAAEVVQPPAAEEPKKSRGRPKKSDNDSVRAVIHAPTEPRPKRVLTPEHIAKMKAAKAEAKARKAAAAAAAAAATEDAASISAGGGSPKEHMD